MYVCVYVVALLPLCHRRVRIYACVWYVCMWSLFSLYVTVECAPFYTVVMPADRQTYMHTYIPHACIHACIRACMHTYRCALFYTVVMPADVTFGPEIRWPFFDIFWGLLGDFDLSLISEYNPAYTNEPTAMLVPFFIWLYLFTATVVLVNLLIAQMSSIYTEVEERSVGAIGRLLGLPPCTCMYVCMYMSRSDR